MTKRLLRVPSTGPPFVDLVSHGRAASRVSRGFTQAYIQQIRRTVSRVPEVMVKVTGGGRKVHAVAEHLSYISHHGELELETDEGQRVPKAGHKELLEDWHLELSAGQYRPRRDSSPRAGINSCTTSCSACRRRRPPIRSWRRQGPSRARSSRSSTDTPWRSIPIRSTRMCIWW